MINLKKFVLLLFTLPILKNTYAIEGYFSQDANIHEFNLTVYGNHFEDKLLEEVKKFDGHTYGAILNIPLNHYNQIQINYPFRTDGSALSSKPAFLNRKIDIHGAAGVFEYATVRWEHKFTDKKNEDYSILGFAQIGQRPTYLKNDLNDKINHRGRLIGGGIRASKNFDNGIHALTDFKLDYYNDTDDLIYSDKVSFFMGDLSLLISHNNLNILNLIQPYVEFRTFADFDKYNTFYLEGGLFANILNFNLLAGYIKGLNNKSDNNIIGLKIRAESDLI